MPPPKKATKKTAAAPGPPHEDASKDMRRAYEHLGRVELLQHCFEKEAPQEIGTLSKLAQRELGAGHTKDAAELLRAAEHLSFAAMHSGTPEKTVAPELVEAIAKEVHHKLGKAEEHWSHETSHDQGIGTIFSNTLARAHKALDARAYRQALELARAAEAVAHVKLAGPKQLDHGAEQPKRLA